MLKILLSGATGRVGREIRRLAEQEGLAEIAGRASRERFFATEAAGDVLIDFSRPELTDRALAFAAKHAVPMVIGTTGLDDGVQGRINQAASSIAICQAANFSIGVNLLLDLVGRAAAGLPEAFEVEIAELHHRWKTDAPSGTALALGRAAAEARGAEPDAVGRVRGDGKRQSGKIGYQVARGGDVVGEHTIFFLGDGERLELTHRASDRAIFARGALHAARWLVNQPPGMYSMYDVLGEAADGSPASRLLRRD